MDMNDQSRLNVVRADGNETLAEHFLCVALRHLGLARVFIGKSDYWQMYQCRASVLALIISLTATLHI